ncbi:riboflavin biosynthesis protein RibF [Gordonibacter pamelaeae]|uniref:riboflavin biosynthesis protein RibF n=1 Tax=Gordonibacter pamelaeae TaxID=471189 RepID=UPI003A8FF3AE
MAEIYEVGERFDHAFFAGTSCAFGVFDGVHAGHRYLLAQARETAGRSGGKSVALTFDIDPDEVFHPDRLKKLMMNGERLAMLAATGVDAVAVLPFTPAFASLSPEAFLEATFDGTAPAYLHVGCDFRFGARAAGTVGELAAWGAGAGCAVAAHDLKSADGAPVTATRIRLLLAEGDIAEANRLLERPYFMTGTVEPGRGEGADLGFRTANLAVPDQLRPLGDGVYAAYAQVDGTRYKAAVNVGVAATFADRATATCEVHLLDFAGDLYGKPVKVEFLHWLRPMRKFDDVEELIATVKDNIQWVRENL